MFTHEVLGLGTQPSPQTVRWFPPRQNRSPEENRMPSEASRGASITINYNELVGNGIDTYTLSNCTQKD